MFFFLFVELLLNLNINMQSYTPQTHTTVTYVQEYNVPAGPAPMPLPTSSTYVRPPKQRKGISGRIGDAFSRVSQRAQNSWNEATDERFRRYFGFPFTEQLYGEFWGEVWTGGQLHSCSVYVSSNYCCLLYKHKDTSTRDKTHIKAVIPLRDITYLQRAVCLPTVSGGTPVIQPITDPSVRPDSLQIFTSDGKMHQFCKFYNYDRFIYTLDYLWRQCKVHSMQGMPNTAPGPNLAKTEPYMPAATGFAPAPTVPHQGY